MCKLRFLIVFGISICWSSLTLAGESSKVMVYRYWDWEKTPLRDDYQYDLLKLALEKTVSAYGPYKTYRFKKYFTSLRARREINRGEYINVHAAPWRDVSILNTEEESLQVDIPIFSLLGFRQLIIRKEDVDLFNSITSEDKLKKLVLAQGQDWVDVNIYKQNGYLVDSSANFPYMLDMLARNRFDYIPMSIVEVESVLSSRPDLADKITVAPNLLIYYPLPILFYVDKHRLDLKQRLAAGLKIIESDGSMEELHNQYFVSKVKFIQQSTTRIFIIKNHLIPQNLLESEAEVFSQIRNGSAD